MAVAFGIIAGFSYSLIVPLATNAIAHSPDEGLAKNASFIASLSKDDLAIIFFLNCFFIFVFKSISMVIINYVAKGAISDLKIKVCRKVTRMPIETIERIDMPKIINILTRDMQNAAGSAVALPAVSISIITIVALLGYIFYLDPIVFMCLVLLLVLGVVSFKLPMRLATKRLQRARELEDDLQEGIRGVVLGIKELKLNNRKSTNYIDEKIIRPELEILRLSRSGDSIMLVVATYSQLIATLLIGIMIFFLADSVISSNKEIFAIVMVVLYLVGPLSVILGYLPALKLGEISLGRISNFSDEKEEGFFQSERAPEWQAIQLQTASYSYNQENDESFSLKPTTIDFRKGKIYYIVGANGSGKTTLAKLLTLHYPPRSGAIFFDKQQISDKNRGSFRESISAIYSDYYLFDRIYGYQEKLQESKIHEYIKFLGLEGKTEFINGRFSNTRLSDGQRRRLALLAALIEDRECYVFDEWAADQDPRFKEIFYNRVLPDLKANNKLVIIITHDDRYFDCADTLIFMEDGGVKKIKEQKEKTPNIEPQVETIEC